MRLTDFWNGECRLGNAVVTGALGMLPLLADVEEDREDLQFLLLDEAISHEVLRVTETGEGGEVPFLLVKNTGDQPVLILEGEELVGGKQNRVVNATLLVPAKSSLRIPVSCMEQGRWRLDSTAFQAGGALFRAKSRARQKAGVSANIRRTGEFRSHQMSVWEEVEDSLDELRAASPTRDFRAARERVSSEIDRYVDELLPQDGQRGAIFFSARGVLGCEWLATSDLLKRAFPKIIRSFAFEVLNAPGVSHAGAQAASAWWNRVLECPIRAFPSPGAGEDLRLENEDLVGSALLWRQRLVHLSCFPSRWDDTGTQDDRLRSRRQSAGERRRRMRNRQDPSES
ncbi:hypothetical protein SAMN02746041_02514 [Desulfacinum hydrothermale DSM 13146]|uniref:ARG and Rhodanese-Phosphatase-superfamily-associated domain-containing protein n=1 Tax=Desulfacinum hydrothermale DSM 13146 TaxID=1121390 RepID=A0A1W1XQB9_9BACT|nr:DUF6569 family protein [Desulfacinum hydrothermale]SMC26052.1 hypothetical protein SAMN02746041_02514 [Desulfacinum hydrothermale DSM 13146]